MSRVGRNIHVSVDRLRQLAHRDARPRKISADAGTCPKCDSHYSADEMHRNLRVCPACGHHFAVTARERLEQLGEPGAADTLGLHAGSLALRLAPALDHMYV